MGEELVLTPRQMAVIASPACSEVLLCLHSVGRASAGEIAKQLGKTPATALYHLRRLEQVGLAVVVDRRPTSRRPEAIYTPASPKLRLPDSDPEGLINKAVLAGMRVAMRGFAAAPGRNYKHVIRGQLRLSVEDTKKFLELLDEANRFAEDRQISEGGVHLHWHSVVYPESKP